MVYKSPVSTGVFLLTLRFILTMWYINHVEEAAATMAETSFILTMWYINCKKFAGSRLAYTSFILTMWYINIFILFL